MSRGFRHLCISGNYIRCGVYSLVLGVVESLYGTISTWGWYYLFLIWYAIIFSSVILCVE